LRERPTSSKKKKRGQDVICDNLKIFVQPQTTRNILNTIIYYDILNYPVTSFEIWKYLTVAEGNAGEKERCGLGDIIEALESEEIKRSVEEYQGFYFFKGRKYLTENRIQNDKNAIVKYKIAEWVAWWLRFVPFVRMVSVTGTLGMKNCEKDSDIDFFVILERGRIFTGRLFVTAMVHVLGRRRYGEKIKNRICLNYFITTESLEIKRQDLFAANEYSFFYPLFGFETYRSFAKENVGWVNKYKPNFEYGDLKPAKYFVEHGDMSRFVQKAKERLINSFGGDRMEAWLKKKQIARIERNPLTKKEGAYIEATDENLIFLPEPQGLKIWEEFKTLTSKNNFI